MQENKTQPEVTRLPNGTEATLLLANLQEGEKLSIVSTEVLKGILSYLPKTTLLETVLKMQEKLNYCKDMGEYLHTLHSELCFHKSVNVMQEFLFKKESVTPDPPTSPKN